MAAGVVTNGSWIRVPSGAIPELEAPLDTVISFASKGEAMVSLRQLSASSSVVMPPLAWRLLLNDLALSLPALFGLCFFDFPASLLSASAWLFPFAAPFALSRFMMSFNGKSRESSCGVVFFCLGV